MLKLAQTNQPTDQPTNRPTNREGKNNMSPTTIVGDIILCDRQTHRQTHRAQTIILSGETKPKEKNIKFTFFKLTRTLDKPTNQQTNQPTDQPTERAKTICPPLL
ncbi:hypothetical protein DPMN_040342 [Dreissena polymorpha]|uniref:Uncharacterized protein n=1 Tax=Dreissena polymorpha TaxID=45954 RepID=A0A9D4CUV1_DREPO|nr:hypothetical protein DPMN_040342 [Dreissena polymorpha]